MIRALLALEAYRHRTPRRRESSISDPKQDPRRTALYERHLHHGARMVDFAGWSMPVQYAGVLKEHECVRTAAAVFDVSHMGELFFSGAGAVATLDNLTTNNVAALQEGQALYTPVCNEAGGVLDDVLIYRAEPERFMMVVNAANVEKIATWSRQHLEPQTHLEDASDEVALLAVQGPRSREVLQRVSRLGAWAASFEELKYYHFLGDGSSDVLFLSRTGYTGELGYELYVRPHCAGDLWDEIMAAGADFGLAPAGLAARDTLRFEVGFCLYGQELDESTSPLEAGLGWTVKLKKERFLGREALVRQKAQGVPRRLLGLRARERVIARSGYEVRAAGQAVGSVTSGTFAPTLKQSLALALVQRAAADEELSVVVRGREVPVEQVRLPFYKPTPPR